MFQAFPSGPRPARGQLVQINVAEIIALRGIITPQHVQRGILAVVDIEQHRELEQLLVGERREIEQIAHEHGVGPHELRRITRAAVLDHRFHHAAGHAQKLVKHHAAPAQPGIDVAEQWLPLIKRDELDFANDEQYVAHRCGAALEYLELRALYVDFDEINRTETVVEDEFIEAHRGNFAYAPQLLAIEIVIQVRVALVRAIERRAHGVHRLVQGAPLFGFADGGGIVAHARMRLAVQLIA